MFAFTRHRIPALSALAAWCLFVLLHDPRFDHQLLWNAGALPLSAPAILILFVLAVAIGAVLVLRFGIHNATGRPII